MLKSITQVIQSVRELETQRAALIEILLADKGYALGSVSKVRRRCGKPNCHCVDGEGHPQMLFLYKGEDGRRVCKLVRNVDVHYMAELGDNYREFRAALKALRATQKRIEEKVMAILRARAVTYE